MSAPQVDLDRHRDQILEALVGPYIAIHHNSATFHAQMHSLAQMLQPWIAALAEAAVHETVGHRAELEQIMHQHKPFFPTDPLKKDFG